MRLRTALGMLSKSSPYAVSTLGKGRDEALEKIKNYLYVETDIERAFRSKLETLKSNEIIFLCGSSGDGKSEILTRYSESFKDKVAFHLDATHSFKPDKTATQTLDDVFDEFSESHLPLVVGINIGMLGNYEREGDERHAPIKSAIKDFLDGNPVQGGYTFINFEAFPKFQISNGEVGSEFFSLLLQKIVSDDSSNPFQEYFNQELANGAESRVVSNYLLLRDADVQKLIVELLFSARIRKDQFITARMLLDFMYCLLTGPGYIFDNVFTAGENELLDVIATFDPSLIRNKELDLFVIHRALDFEDQQYVEFVAELDKRFKIRVKNDDPPQSMIRCLYLLKGSSLESTYNVKFADLFNEEALSLYKQVWQLHKDYDGSSEAKAKLKPFYQDIVRPSITKYANRNAPYLTGEEFYISSHRGSHLAAEVEITFPYQFINNDNSSDISHFCLYLKVNDEQLEPVQVNVNLLRMMIDIVNGFRPNKHDKNSVVLLDELVSKIKRHASASDTLYLHARDHGRIRLKETSDGEIRVSGI
jgi:DNA phosphorothioation-dependent restriction protein DptF